jgi:hypothetical protein
VDLTEARGAWQDRSPKSGNIEFAVLYTVQERVPVKLPKN